MDGGHGESLMRVRVGKASSAHIKAFTDSEVSDEHTIKVIHRKKVVKLCYSPVLRGL